LKVGEKGKGTGSGPFSFPCRRDPTFVLGVIAMGEVDPEDVDAGAAELLHSMRSVTRRTERGDDLCAAADEI
jgi:hypothetical protein